MENCPNCGFVLVKPSEQKRRKPRDLSRFPPGATHAEVDAVINSICGCKGNYDCDCVSVFTIAGIQMWTAHNTKG